MALVLVAVWLGATGAWGALHWDRLSERCPGYDGEGIMAAPRSAQGRLLCGEDLVAGRFSVLVLGAMGLLLLLALVLWARRSRVVTVLVTVVVAGLAPTAVSEAALLLPDGCSREQWAQYGAEGCEQDREMR
ncbi:hypothetical protein [Pimelobacter simplex]|uniref:hypothetical protein n=1 Tax=Nocardioides simplex TaxID=2045 RepID=UPI0019326264